MDLPGELFGVGKLRLVLQGSTGNWERWMANAAVEQAALTADLGVVLNYSFAISGGEITEQEPD